MSEESKYYTPQLSEFHVGFEYQRFEDNVWFSTTIDNNWQLADYVMYLANFGFDKTRVKCLDREDIESIGFSIISEAKLKEYGLTTTGETHFVKTIRERTYVDEDIIITITYNNLVIIRRNNTKNLRYYYNNKTFDLFVGKVRNKSELKLLMQMLDI